MPMESIETNKEIVRRLFDAFADVDLDLMDELVSDDFVAHGLGPAVSADAQGWKDVAQHMNENVSDLAWEVNDVIAEQDKVTVRWTCRGSHTGDLFGMGAGHRNVTVTGIEIYRLVDDKVSEYWGAADMSDLYPADG